MDNQNLKTKLCANSKNGSIRDSYFVSQDGLDHQVHYHDKGDFIDDDKLVFEVGGASKDTGQLEGQKGYAVADNIEIGFDMKIPLWLFGFLYYENLPSICFA